MLPDYADIRALTDREPDWHDRDGVPRYAPFRPDMLGVYDTFALLVEIGCQGCAERLLVGQGWTDYDLRDLIRDGQATKRNLRTLAEGFGYGDPPRHKVDDRWCASGATMSSYPIRIVEAWEQGPWVQGKGHEWQRNAEVEAIDVAPDWAEDLL